MPAQDQGSFARRSVLVARNRLRLGAGRVRQNSSQTIQVIIGATFAFSFCKIVLGHEYPFLAAVAATVGTGVTADRRLRRACEIGFGATLGVLVGELVMEAFGAGLWQMAVVLTCGLIIGNLINSGAIFVTQVSIQSLYVITVPISVAAKPFDRTTDAITGATVAILMALIVPSDARKKPRDRASALLTEISELLAQTASALRTADSDIAYRALERARDSQAIIDSWRSSLRISQEATRINARSRRYAAEVNRLARACEYADRSMRLVRVVLRRVVAMADAQNPHDEIADVISDLARGAEMLRVALRRGTSRIPAQDFLAEVAGRLDIHAGFVHDLNDETLVLLLRPLANDLLCASGLSEEGAGAMLPPLSDAIE